RPIILRGQYPGLYRDRFEEWKLGGHPEFVQELRAGRVAADRLRSKLDVVERQLSFLASQLNPADAAALSSYEQEYRRIADGAIAKGAADAAQSQRLDAMTQEISQKFDPNRAVLQEKVYWPVLSQLTAMNVLFLALAGMTVVVLLARRFLPPGLQE